jgi:hypothetical protein
LHPWLWLRKERPNWQRDPKSAKHKEKGADDSPTRHSRRFLKLSHCHLSQFSFRPKGFAGSMPGRQRPKVPRVPPILSRPTDQTCPNERSRRT